MVTVGDIITDLPRFEWINPHAVIPETGADKEERWERISRDIAQYPVNRGEQWIGTDKLLVATPFERPSGL
jgi:hypothetical protein